jgi:hypothetical protein
VRQTNRIRRKIVAVAEYMPLKPRPADVSA